MSEPNDQDRIAELYKQHASLWRRATLTNPTIALTGPPKHDAKHTVKQYEKALGKWRKAELEDPDSPLD